MNAAAFDGAGYLVDQSRVEALYGRYPTRKNGCGWIAAYNLGYALGCPWGPEQVCRMLEKGLCFGGALGTGPLRLRRWLKLALGHKVSLRRPGRAGPGPGILFYWTGDAFHYIAYLPAPEGVRLVNVRPGCKNLIVPSVKAFLAEKKGFQLAFCLQPR